LTGAVVKLQTTLSQILEAIQGLSNGQQAIAEKLASLTNSANLSSHCASRSTLQTSGLSHDVEWTSNENVSDPPDAGFTANAESNHNEILISDSEVDFIARQSKSRKIFACKLADHLFTIEERLSSNCAGAAGRTQLDSRRLEIIRNVVQTNDRFKADV